jgi:hypothetical protein
LSVDSVSVSVAGNTNLPDTIGFQYIPLGATQSGDIIAISARLGTSPFTDDLATMTIYVDCSTGVEVQLPEVINDSVTTTENVATSFNVLTNDIDPDGVLQPATVVNTSNPGSGILVNNGNGNFAYTPALGFTGSDSFGYQVCAGADLCFSATVSIIVEAASSVNNGQGGIDDVPPVQVDAIPDAPPACDQAQPSIATLWPPNHQFVPVTIVGLGNPGESTVEITALISNELETAPGSGNTGPDVDGLGTDTALLRAERAGNGAGRTYIILFIASNALGTCEGSVQVNVPHDMGGGATVDVDNNGPSDNNNRPRGNGNRNGNANGNRNGNGNANSNRNGHANGRGRG